MQAGIKISGIKTGMILLWSGAIVDIPTGFVLCDGTNDTPDLQDKFIVGAGSGYAVDENGGVTTHNHTVNQQGHTHSLPAGPNIMAGSDIKDDTSQEDPEITCEVSSHVPPYYALCYIMKT